MQAAELAVLGGISERIAHHTAPDLALVLEQCLDAGGISAGAIYGLEGGRLEGHARKGFTDDAAEALGGWLATDLEWVFARAAPSLVDDRAPGGRDLCKRAGGELLMTPLTSRGERLGVLALASRAREPGGEEWLSFVHTVATQIGLALALTRTFSRLGESEAQFRQLAENLREVVWIGSTTGESLYVSPSFERVWGVSLSALAADPGVWMKSVHPDDRAQVAANLAQLASEERDVMYRVVRSDGDVRWIRDRSTPVRDPSGSVVRSVGIAEDVTELKQAAEVATRAAKVAAFNAAVGVALAECDDLEEALRRCASAGVEQLDATFCRIWTLDPERREPEIHTSAGPDLHPGGSELVRVIAETGRPHLSNAVSGDTRIDRDWAARHGLVAFAGYPLHVEGKLEGVLTILARSPLDDLTLDALGTAARVIAIGLRRKLDEATRTSLEAQLRQAQKMEAVGRLAGGVAHDFNNLLTAIMGYSELLLAQLRPQDPYHKEVEEIHKAGGRAAALTRQLLVFSRHQVLELKALDLNAIVADLEKMLRRLIGEDVELVVKPTRPLGRIRADASQVEQVVLNLCVNARDAMPRGGRLVIETGDAMLSAADRLRGPALAGEHVRLRVTDTGTGMTPEVLAHLFEPFFTTKEEGKGTGLGLSTVWGIVRGAGGGVSVSSEPGKGSSFEVYFPRVEVEVPAPRPQTPTRPLLRGVETVLLVEDDEGVRELAQHVLEMGGYRLIVAENGPAALEASDRHAGTIDLVLTDVVMPGMSGRELVDQLLPRRPGLRVLYFSGYTSGVVLQDDVLGEGSPFLGKPFSPAALLRKVREVLDAGRR